MAFTAVVIWLCGSYVQKMHISVGACTTQATATEMNMNANW